MANGHGGQRTPSNPAPVSGPGALSQRTDGGPAQPVRPVTGLPYGEGQDFTDLQSSAPMAKATTPRTPTASGGGSGPAPQGAPAAGFSDPTAYPDEPVTAGNPFGPGPGPEALSTGLSQMSAKEAQSLSAYLPALESMANSEAGTDSFRRFVRYLRSVSE